MTTKTKKKMMTTNNDDRVYARILWHCLTVRRDSINQSLVNMRRLMDSFNAMRPMNSDDATIVKDVLMRDFSEEEQRQAEAVYAALWEKETAPDVVNAIINTSKQ